MIFPNFQSYRWLIVAIQDPWLGLVHDVQAMEDMLWKEAWEVEWLTPPPQISHFVILSGGE